MIFLGENFFLKFSQIFSNFLEFSRNTFLCIGIPGKFSQIFSNFLKFSLFFSNFLEGGGVPDRGGLSQTFVVFDFLGEKLSQNFQILSECIFCIGGMLGKYYPKFFKVAHGRFFFA